MILCSFPFPQPLYFSFPSYIITMSPMPYTYRQKDACLHAMVIKAMLNCLFYVSKAHVAMPYVCHFACYSIYAVAHHTIRGLVCWLPHAGRDILLLTCQPCHGLFYAQPFTWHAHGYAAYGYMVMVPWFSHAYMPAAMPEKIRGFAHRSFSSLFLCAYH